MPLLITAILVVGAISLILFSVWLMREKSRAVDDARQEIERRSQELKHRSEKLDDEFIKSLCIEDIGETVERWRRGREDLYPTATAECKPAELQNYLASERRRAGQEINARLLRKAVFGFCAIIGIVVLSSLAIYSLADVETQTVSSTMNK